MFGQLLQKNTKIMQSSPPFESRDIGHVHRGFHVETEMPAGARGGVVIRLPSKDGRKMGATSLLCALYGLYPTMDLPALRQLKNSVIGNTWKKVQLAADTPTLTDLILLLHPANSPDTVYEAAVIVASIATVGNLTLRPIITNNTPARLLHLIHPLVHTQQHRTAQRQLTALLRALRNVLVATADMVWGHVWGVGAEKKVVGTGLVGENILRETPADRSRDKHWRNDAIAALTIVFEVSSSCCSFRFLPTHAIPCSLAISPPFFLSSTPQTIK